MAKKATVAQKGGGFLLYGSWGHGVRVRISLRGVYEPTQTIRIISTILLKIFMQARCSFFLFFWGFVLFCT